MAPDPENVPVPEHELEMAAEEALGRPLAGPAAERAAKLQGRMDYLNKEIHDLVQAVRDGRMTEEDAADEKARLTEELGQAEHILSDFLHQQRSGN